MISKRVLTELIQNRLAGGDAPADVQGKYPKQVIGRLLGLVYSDLASQNKKTVRNMSLPYELAVTSSSGQYFCTLPVSPINGLAGIVWVSGSGMHIPISQGVEENNIMSSLLPMVNKRVSRIVGSKMYFNSNPNQEFVDVEILPDYNSLSDDDNVCVEGVQSQLFNMVIAMMRQGASPLEEVYNNRVPDTDKPTQPAR